jgi:NAD-dependent DNA ligase
LLSHLQALDPLDAISALKQVAAPSPEPVVSNVLAHRKIAVSGMLPHATQAEIEAQLSACGALVVTAIEPGCDVVLLGLNYDPQIANAALASGLAFIGVEWLPTLLKDPSAALRHAQFNVPRSVLPTTEPSFKRIPRPSESE